MDLEFEDVKEANEQILELKAELEEVKSALRKNQKELSDIRLGIDEGYSRLNKDKQDLELQRLRFQRQFEIERASIEKDKLLFEVKLKKLELELFNLANEKEKLLRDRQRLEVERSQVNTSVSLCLDDAGKLFFYGAMDESEIKSRYRSLIKIYHPDNTNGSTTNLAIRIINHEYERLRGIHKSLNSYR